MAIRLILGKTGSGKTEKIYRELVEQSKALTASETLILIVPEQMTLDVQHDIIRAHNHHCITNIEVLSFGRLAYRMGDELGIAGKTVISDVGKNIMIRDIIDQSPEDYPFLRRNIHKKGYTNELRSLMTEFSRYTMTDEDLGQVISGMDEGLLSYKLSDCKMLYKSFNETVSENYLSGESLMDLMVSVCHKSDWLKATTVYIDGFYGFTPIQYQLITKMMYTVKELNIVVTMDLSYKQAYGLEESHLYYESYFTYNRLKQLAKDNQIMDYEEVDVEEQKSHEPGFLAHIRDNLYQYPYKVYSEKPEGFYLSNVSSPRTEVAYVRDSILKLVVNKEVAYNDIVVLAGDTSRYERLVKEMFADGEIPYYIDKKQQIISNDVVGFVMNIVKLLRFNMSYESIFDYIKSDYTLYDVELVDYMENYVIRYGIKGRHRWKQKWVLKVPDIRMAPDEPAAVVLLERINELRMQIIEPIEAIFMTKKATTAEHVNKLYQLLSYHGIEEKVQKKSDNYLEKLDYNRSREYAQIYKIIMNLLDQLCEVGGDKRLDYNEFYSLLESGVEELELGLVPASMDQVILGDLTRTRISRKKAVFIMGVNEGLVPALKDGTGLLTDRERDYMEANGFKLAPSARKTLFRDQFYIYMSLLKATERLYMSYTLMNDEGKVTRPSHLVHMLQKILPHHKKVNIDEYYKEKVTYNNPNILFKQLLKSIQQKNGLVKPVVRTWFESQKDWHNKLDLALEGQSHHLLKDHLSSQISGQLYKQTLMNSVSRLEQFSKCAFAHFAIYGLKAKEREVYEITMPQLGLIFHRVIELFSKRVLNREMDWSEVTDDLRTTWIDELVVTLLEQGEHQVFFDNKRNQYRINRLKNMLNRALWAIGYQIVQGDFRPLSAEWQFKGDDPDIRSLNIALEQGKKMCLRGTIDRVDYYKNDSLNYVTIVDYKSSNQEFDIGDIYDGLQLQLLVYLNAAVEVKEKELDETVQPAGIFYFKIDDPYISVPMDETKEEADAIILGQFQLKGVVLDDPEVVKSLDRFFVGKSKVIPVTKNKNGQLSKASKTLELEEFEALQLYVRNKTITIGNRIVSGEIEANPIKKKEKKACDYCLYSGVCQFDNSLETHNYRELKPTDYMEKIKEEVKKGYDWL